MLLWVCEYLNIKLLPADVISHPLFFFIYLSAESICSWVGDKILLPGCVQICLKKMKRACLTAAGFEGDSFFPFCTCGLQSLSNLRLTKFCADLSFRLTTTSIDWCNLPQMGIWGKFGKKKKSVAWPQLKVLKRFNL